MGKYRITKKYISNDEDNFIRDDDFIELEEIDEPKEEIKQICPICAKIREILKRNEELFGLASKQMEVEMNEAIRQLGE